MDEPSATRASLPKGYSFVSKGNAFITGNCRRHAQAASHVVYVVFKNGDKKIRIGIGVPTNIYLHVQLDERNTRSERVANVLKRDEHIAKEFKKAIMKNYPRIPASDVSGILEKALEKGKGKVGRTSTLDISKKVTLAVRAYIRHQHTNYDTLLRGGMDRDEARREAAAKVRSIDKAWNRTASRRPGQIVSRQQTPEPIVARRTSTSPRSKPLLARQVQADTPKPGSTKHQLADTWTRNSWSSEPNTTDQSESNVASVDPAMQNLGEMRRQKLLGLVAQIQGNERNLSHKDFKGNKRRRKSILLLRKKIHKLLDEAGLQARVESSGALKHFAEQLRLIAPDSIVEPRLLKPDMPEVHQTQTNRPQSQVAVEREQNLGAGHLGNADVQRVSLKKTKIVIDLTGDSDDDDVFSVQTNTATHEKRNCVAAGGRFSDATAREHQIELRELSVGDTGQALRPRRRAGMEADRVLSKCFHSRRARENVARTSPR